MKEIFQIREILIIFYRKNENWIIPIIKFLSGILIFTLINKFGYVKSLSQIYVIILMGILTMVLPVSLISFLMAVMIVIQLLTVSLELAVITGIVLICLLLFYIRIFPKESLLIFGMVLAYYFKVPYTVVFIGAIFFGFSAIAPITIGTFIWYCIPMISELAKTGGNTIKGLASKDLLEIPSEFANVYINIMDTIKSDQTWIISVIIFAMIIIIMYIISHLQLDYSPYLSILIGSALNIISFMMSTLIAEANIGIGNVIIFTILSAIIVCIVQFFTRVLDYSSAEKIQFEDDSNYYYVKVVPKISMSKFIEKPKPKKNKTVK